MRLLAGDARWGRPARRALAVLAVAAFAFLSWVVYRGYLTTDMMVYFLTFQWCF